jgi:hypothetical protein
VEPDPAGADQGRPSRSLQAETDLWEIVTRIAACQCRLIFPTCGGAFFEHMSAEWRAEQDRCLREIERHQSADQCHLEEGVRLLELARNAQRAF